MPTNNRNLRIDPVYRNLSYAQGTDKFGAFLMALDKALVAAYDVTSGTGWRREGAGDGLSSFTTTLDANLWTANGGKGYYDGGSAASSWATNVRGVANSCTNTLAWARYSEWHNGSRTGRQFQWQRTASTTVNNDPGLNAAFATGGFSGTPSATSPYTTSTTHQWWYGASAWNVNGPSWCSSVVSTNSSVGGAGNMGFQIWTSAKPFGNMSQFAVMGYGSNNDLGFFGGYFALRESAAGDSQPFICGVNTHAAVAGGDPLYTTTASGFLSSAGTVIHGQDGSGAWWPAVGLRFVGGVGTTFPPGSATLGRPNISGAYTILPCFVELDNALGTASLPKGTLVDVVLPVPAETGHIFAYRITDDIGDVWLGLGGLALPWEVGLSVSNWSGNQATVTSQRYGRPATIDSTEPTIGAASPAAGAITYDQAITVPIADSGSGIASVVISADYDTPDRHELIATGAPLSPTVDGDYTVTPSGTTASASLVVSRTGGWLGPFTLRVRATDASGNVSSVYTQSYTISTSPNPAAPDTTAPVIGTFSPAAGAIAYNQAISIPLSDDKSSFKYTVVISQAETGVADEYAWNGYTMSADYAAGSSFPSSGTAVVLRDGGWPGSFTVRVTAYDAAGNWRSETTSAYTISGANPAAPDIAPPELSLVSPVNSVISKQTPVVLQVSDNRALRAFAVYAAFDSVAPAELVYSATYPWLVTNYRVVVESTGETTRTLTVTRKGEGWRKAPRFFLEATDSSGNKTS